MLMTKEDVRGYLLDYAGLLQTDPDSVTDLVKRIRSNDARRGMGGASDHLMVALAEYIDREDPDRATVEEWRSARRAFLALPPNSPDARTVLDRLANAEAALMKGTAE